MSSFPLRWGVLAPGRIAESFVGDLHASHSGRAVACGSRNLERAQAFSSRFGIERAYGSYEQLLTDAEVDIVYVASPHNFHARHVLAALDAGKHVLCEKPLALNAQQVRQMFARAQERRLFLMEALWTYFLPPLQQALAWVAEGRIGDVHRVRANFGFAAQFDPAGRLFNLNLAGGALLDVGVYTLSVAQRLLGNLAPSLEATAQIGSTGVDETTNIGLTYPDGRRAELVCSIRQDMDNSAWIEGSSGVIRVPDFWRARSVQLKTSNETQELSFPRETGGYEFQAQSVTSLLQQGLTEHPVFSGEFSLRLATTMDAVRAQIGLIYPDEV